ncbi:MAG: hypothetical protein LBO09_04675 [Candidatus Peribacteria bacterium]|jgi:hypothetical protein|nr:hypothetical protein [Candidatus Peribacteria bacterium]
MMLHDKKIDVIQVEHNRCAISSRTFFKDYYDLLHEDYHIYRELSRKHGLVKIESYEPALENFTYINYVLIRK